MHAIGLGGQSDIEILLALIVVKEQQSEQC